MVERPSKAGDQRAAARTDNGGADDRGREQDADNRPDNGALTPTVMGLAMEDQGFAIAVLDERRIGDIYLARFAAASRAAQSASAASRQANR